MKPRRMKQFSPLSMSSNRWVNKYDKSNPRSKYITESLALFVGSTSVPNNIVEEHSFITFVEASVGKEIGRLAEEMCQNIHVYMDKATTVHFCTDIWSKKGLTSSYLGVTAHFFTRGQSLSFGFARA